MKIPVKDESELQHLTGHVVSRSGPLLKIRKRGPQRHQELVNGCIQYLRLKGIECAEFKQGKVQFHGRWIHFGKAPGWPDIIGLWPPDGMFFGVEAKVGRDRQSLDQKEAQRRIEAAGGRYYVVASMDELAEIFG